MPKTRKGNTAASPVIEIVYDSRLAEKCIDTFSREAQRRTEILEKVLNKFSEVAYY